MLMVEVGWNAHLVEAVVARCCELVVAEAAREQHCCDQELWEVVAAEVQRWWCLDWVEVGEQVLGSEAEAELKICVRR